MGYQNGPARATQATLLLLILLQVGDNASLRYTVACCMIAFSLARHLVAFVMRPLPLELALPMSKQQLCKGVAQAASTSSSLALVDFCFSGGWKLGRKKPIHIRRSKQK